MVRHSSNRNPFSNGLSCFYESSEILSMTYVVLKGYLYDPIDYMRPVIAIELEKYKKIGPSQPSQRPTQGSRPGRVPFGRGAQQDQTG
jgi:hypothetical protein